MVDREKLLKALELCASGCDGIGCVYLEDADKRNETGDCVRCVDLMSRDALELLDEQGWCNK